MSAAVETARFPAVGRRIAIHTMMSNTLLPADGKGVLVALRPLPGIRDEQALTLCRKTEPAILL